MYLSLVIKLLKLCEPNNTIMVDCFLRLSSYSNFDFDALCMIMKEHSQIITSYTMNAIVKHFLEKENDDMSLTLFNMCINGLFPKIDKKEIELNLENQLNALNSNNKIEFPWLANTFTPES